MSEYKCSKCKGEIKRTKTAYGYSYDCSCGEFSLQTYGNMVLLTSENNLK